MNNKEDIQQILPWNNHELQALLKEVISHGSEAAKLDFKLEIELNTPEQKAELLKDITAIVNTYDNTYADYGFLIYGVAAKVIAGTTQTESNADKLQNQIEQLLKTYIAPMPQIYVIPFETDLGIKWGTVVIPPRNNKPYMFVKDLSCPTNPTKSRKRGDWFVRKGSTTDRGLPEDLTLIIQKQTELLVEPLRESIRGLQARLAKTEDQYNSALFRLVERAMSGASGQGSQKDQKRKGRAIESSRAVEIVAGLDLPTRLKQQLRTPADAIAEDLLAEAKVLRDYLDGTDTGLPWTPQLGNAEDNKRIITDLESKTRSFQLSVATIALHDNTGVYTDACTRAIKMLAKGTEIPPHVPYNRIGEALRYYPLGIVLYTVFICGVAAGRWSLMKKVLDIPLKHRRENVTAPIVETVFYWSGAKPLFNDAFGQRWCEPIAQRIKQVIADHVIEMIPEFSETEAFFRGEFVFALTYIDLRMAVNKDVEKLVPLPGLYLYTHDIYNPIGSLLLEHPDWLDKLYNHALSEILESFDRNAAKVVAPDCFATGLFGFSASEIYRQSMQKRPRTGASQVQSSG